MWSPMEPDEEQMDSIRKDPSREIMLDRVSMHYYIREREWYESGEFGDWSAWRILRVEDVMDGE